MRVHFVAYNAEGAGRIRCGYPALALRENGISATAATFYPQPGEADLVIVHRPKREHQPIRDALRQRGSVVLIQDDDNLSSVAEAFDCPPDLRFEEAHAEAIRQSDGLIVTTRPLVDVYGPLAPRTWIVPNFLPRWIQDVRGVSYALADYPDYPRVGWQGMVRTHRKDLEWFRPEARRALDGAAWTTVGETAVSTFLALWGVPVEEDGFVDDPFDFYSRVARADIGIVPLDPSLDLNLSKSWLKALEFMTLGKPVVGVDLPEQRALIEHGVNGFLARTPADFADHVQRLVRDRPLREDLGAAAKEKAAGMALEDEVGCWLSVIEEVEEGRDGATRRRSNHRVGIGRSA